MCDILPWVIYGVFDLKVFLLQMFFFLFFFSEWKISPPGGLFNVAIFLKQYICFVHFNFCDFLMILAVFIELIVARKRHPIDFDHKLCSNGIHRTWEKVNILAQYKKIIHLFYCSHVFVFDAVRSVDSDVCCFLKCCARCASLSHWF